MHGLAWSSLVASFNSTHTTRAWLLLAVGAKAGGQLVLILAIGTLVIVAAYYIVKELFPT